jgi:RNA polymerase sigma factor (sigma-70 family)
VSQPSEVVEHLRRAVLLRDGAGLTDGELLERYVGDRDAAALAALVRRHGPMVWGVCRRALDNYHDAEDAFQATFLVLARRAAAVVPPAMVGNWLYGVAHRTALKARARAARRGQRERQVAEMPEPAPAGHDGGSDLRPVLDQELRRLPDIYRSVLVLCDLEGRTRTEAAQHLGCPEGTVAGRLARARAMLAKRLARQGVLLSGGVVAALLSEAAATAGVPAALVSSTIKTVSIATAGQAAAAGVVSADVAALARGGLKAMLPSRLMLITLVLLLAVGGAGVGVLGCAAVAGKRADSPAARAVGKGTSPGRKAPGREARPGVLTLRNVIVQSVDGAKGSVLATLGNGNFGFWVAEDAAIADGTKAVRLADLKKGTPVTVRMAVRDNQLVAVGIGAGEPGPAGGPDAKNATAVIRDAVLMGADTDKRDASKRRVIASVGNHQLSYYVAKDARITDGGKEVQFNHLKPGASVTLRFAVRDNSIQIIGISAGDKRKAPEGGKTP